ncbi:hypothetical protein BHE74_00024716 [Ensete ventricosum]|nr:hypothetical protein BHE74_00024716 [Ensete ventricosum]RZR76220.1 hypothetical protein BHM03_00000873 [Ensete ventricosum]
MRRSLGDVAALTTSPPLLVIALDEENVVFSSSEAMRRKGGGNVVKASHLLRSTKMLKAADVSGLRRRIRRSRPVSSLLPIGLGSSRVGGARSGRIEVLPLSFSSSFSHIASSSLAATGLISPSSGWRRSKSIVTDLFQAVIGRKQPISSDTRLDQWYLLVAGDVDLCLFIETKVRNLVPYRHIDQLPLQYIPSCTEHTDIWYTKVPSCTKHTGPLSDRYIQYCKP